MGRRSKKNKQSSKGLGAKPESVCGRTVFTLAVGNATIPISPASFPRLLAMADVFNLYRFTKLKFSIYPAGNTAVGYSNGEFDTPPTTVAQIMEIAYAGLNTATQSVPTHVNVPRSELLGDSTLKWYKTIAGTPAVGFEVQGNLFVLAGAIQFFVVEWTCEFTQWNLAANSPLKNPSIVIKNDDSVQKDANPAFYSKTDDVIVVGGVTYRKSGVVPSPSALLQ